MTAQNFDFITTKRDGLWLEGRTSDYGYRFHAKVYNEGSQYGINEGRISKLHLLITNGDQRELCIACYERGWDIEPGNTDWKRLTKALVTFLENQPNY